MRRRAALLGLALVVAGGPLLAQTDNPFNSALQFNFSSPGARSLGLGGAFIGLANDATAAYTNPAGLAQLERQQIAIEGRTFDFTSVSPFAGTVGEPTGIGVDTQALQTLELEDDTTSLSFLSYVLPVSNFRIAFYRHQVANFEGSFRSEGIFNGPYQVDFGNGVADEFAVRVNPFQGTAELDIENLGVSFAYRLGDSFSIGAGASWYNFDIDSNNTVYDFTGPGVGNGEFFGPPDFSPNNVAFNLVESGDDDDIGWNAGFLWNLTRSVSFGGVYRSGASFDYLYAARFADGREPLTTQATFNMPDVYGAGLAFRLTPSFTITADVNRVEYSALTEDFAILTSDQLDPNDFEAEDATEWHVGLEYQFINMRYPIFLRAGVWEDPAHNLRYTRSTDRNRVYSASEFVNELFPVAVSEALFSGAAETFDDEMHYAGGFGINFGSFILDVAADFSDLVNTASLSGVFRF